MQLAFTEFYYVRHGRTTDNAADIISGGDRDPLLDTVGLQQAETLATSAALKSLAGKVSHLITSSNRRAIQTADIVAASLPAMPRLALDEFKEWHVGDWTGREDAIYGPQLQSWLVDPPGGESRADFTARIARAFNLIASCPCPLLVAHAALWWPLQDLFRIGTTKIKLPNCALMHVTLAPQPNGWQGQARQLFPSLHE